MAQSKTHGPFQQYSFHISTKSAKSQEENSMKISQNAKSKAEFFGGEIKKGCKQSPKTAKILGHADVDYYQRGASGTIRIIDIEISNIDALIENFETHK